MKSLFIIINHSKELICFEELKINLQLSLKCGGVSWVNHRRKKKKPKQIRKEAVQIKPIVEEKPLKKSSNKLVDILLGILLFQFLYGLSWKVVQHN